MNRYCAFANGGKRILCSSTFLLVVLALDVDADAFFLNNRWTATASNSSTGPFGSPATVTWSIVPDGTNLDENGEPPSPSSLIQALDIRFPYATPLPGFPIATPEDLIRGYVNRPWFPLFESIFARLEGVSGVTYLYEPKEDGLAQNVSVTRGVLGLRGDARIGGHSLGPASNTLAFSYYPPYGEMVINTDLIDTLMDPTNNYRQLRNLLTHEAMHGLGVKHVISKDAQFVMEPGTSLSLFDGPQLDDILALQRAYGGTEEKFGGNDTTAKATPLGLLGLGQHLARGTAGGTTLVAPLETDFLSIDDDSDVDYFRFDVPLTASIALSVTPQGPVYNQGEENGLQHPFDARRQSDLSLDLLNVQLIAVASATQHGLGEAETISSNFLPAGRYYVRVSGRQNSVQMYRLDLFASIPEPAAIIVAVPAIAAGMARRRSRSLR